MNRFQPHRVEVGVCGRAPSVGRWRDYAAVGPSSSAVGAAGGGTTVGTSYSHEFNAREVYSLPRSSYPNFVLEYIGVILPVVRWFSVGVVLVAGSRCRPRDRSAKDAGVPGEVAVRAAVLDGAG